MISEFKFIIIKSWGDTNAAVPSKAGILALLVGSKSHLSTVLFYYFYVCCLVTMS